MERQERLAQVIDALDEIVLPFKHVGRWALLVEDAPLDEVLEALPYAPEVKVATVGSGVLVAVNRASKALKPGDEVFINEGVAEGKRGKVVWLGVESNPQHGQHMVYKVRVGGVVIRTTSVTPLSQYLPSDWNARTAQAGREREKIRQRLSDADKASYNATTIPDVYRRLQALRYPLRVQGNTVIVDADTNPDELRRVLGDPYNVRIRHEIGRTYLEVQTAAAASLDAGKGGFAPDGRITLLGVADYLRREGLPVQLDRAGRRLFVPLDTRVGAYDREGKTNKIIGLLNKLGIWYRVSDAYGTVEVMLDSRVPVKAAPMLKRIELGVKAAVAAKRGMRLSPEEVEGRLQASGLSYRPMGAGVYLVTFNDEQMQADPRSLVPLFPQADNVDIRAQEGGIQVAVKLVKPSAALGQQVFNKLEQHRNNYKVERKGYVRARVSHPSGRLVTVKEIDDLLADMPQLTFVQSGNAVIVNIAPSSPDEHQIIETYPASGRQPGIHVVQQPGSRYRGAWPIASIQKRRRSKKPL